MITVSSSAYHLELESEDALELLRIAQLLGLDPAGICKVSVTIIRQGIDEGDLYARFTRHARECQREIDAQLDWTQP